MQVCWLRIRSADSWGVASWTCNPLAIGEKTRDERKEGDSSFLRSTYQNQHTQVVAQ